MTIPQENICRCSLECLQTLEDFNPHQCVFSIHICNNEDVVAGQVGCVSTATNRECRWVSKSQLPNAHNVRSFKQHLHEKSAQQQRHQPLPAPGSNPWASCQSSVIKKELTASDSGSKPIASSKQPKCRVPLTKVCSILFHSHLGNESGLVVWWVLLSPSGQETQIVKQLWASHGRKTRMRWPRWMNRLIAMPKMISKSAWNMRIPGQRALTIGSHAGAWRLQNFNGGVVELRKSVFSYIRLHFKNSTVKRGADAFGWITRCAVKALRLAVCRKFDMQGVPKNVKKLYFHVRDSIVKFLGQYFW